MDISDSSPESRSANVTVKYFDAQAGTLLATDQRTLELTKTMACP